MRPYEVSLQSFEVVGSSHKISSTLTLSTLGTVCKHQECLLPLGTSVTAQVAGDVPLRETACSVGLFSGLG